MQTLQERFGRLEGLKLAFVGDGNNVAHSLMLTAGAAGNGFRGGDARGLSSRMPDIVAQASRSSGQLTSPTIRREALAGRRRGLHRCVGQHGAGSGSRSAPRAFAPYQVNEELFAQARPDAIFMHCLPAKRGEEVTDAVMESPRSVVFDQAENRLHAQKALLVMLLG